MGSIMNESVLEMLEAIYKELKSIKKQFKPETYHKETKICISPSLDDKWSIEFHK